MTTHAHVERPDPLMRASRRGPRSSPTVSGVVAWNRSLALLHSTLAALSPQCTGPGTELIVARCGEAGESLLRDRSRDRERQQRHARQGERRADRPAGQPHRRDHSDRGGEEADREVTYPRLGEPYASRQDAHGHPQRRDERPRSRGRQ